MPVTGERLIETHRGMLAVALLNRGLSCAKAAAIAGISKNGALALRRWGMRHKTRLQAIESLFRDKSKVIADWALSEITPKKLKKASARDCVAIAKEAGLMGGLVTTSPVPGVGQLLVLQQFNLRQGLPSISALDQASNPPKQPQTLASETDSGTADGNGQFEVDP